MLLATGSFTNSLPQNLLTMCPTSLKPLCLPLYTQVGLSLSGYSCDDDEMSWWQFGPTTLEALRCYQVRLGQMIWAIAC